MEQSSLLYVIIFLVIGIAFTVWVFRKRRHVDNQGLEKGTAKNPRQVKKDNPPDAH